MATNSKKRKLHLSRVPAYGTSVLTKCGRRRNIGTFTNPNARLCAQCLALAEEEGMSVEMTWVPDAYGGETRTGKWSVKASPPMLERVGNMIYDRNNPDAPAVALTADRVLAMSDISLDEYYAQHGPGSELVTG